MRQMRLVDANKINVEEILYGGCNFGKKIEMQTYISKLPTIDPETLPIVQALRAELAKRPQVVHAHWEDMEPENTHEEHEYRCSKCLAYDVIHPDLMHNAKFCHRCGAKMDEVIENE